MIRFKKQLLIGLAACLMLSLCACSSSESESSQNSSSSSIAESSQSTDVTETNESSTVSEESNQENPESGAEQQEDTLYLQIGDTQLTAELADNSSAQALVELLADGPLTLDLQDYGNMEKVGPLGTELPRNDEQITTEPGDIILYQGDSLVIYYAPNSWNFTRLGKISDISESELRELLGDGDVTVTLSLEQQ